MFKPPSRNKRIREVKQRSAIMLFVQILAIGKCKSKPKSEKDFEQNNEFKRKRNEEINQVNLKGCVSKQLNLPILDPGLFIYFTLDMDFLIYERNCYI